VSDTSFDDLIQAKLDGTASPQEALRLEALLQSDPRVRARQDELAAVFTALAGRTLETPPADLSAGILRAVRQTPEAVRRAPREAARPAFSWFRLALPAAAVCAALVLVWAAYHDPASLPGDTPALSGSLASLDGHQQHIRLSHDASSLEVNARPAGAGLTAIELHNGSGPVQVSLLAAPDAVELNSLSASDAGTRIGGPDGAGLRFDLAPGARISVTSRTRTDGQTLRVILTTPDGASTPARLELEPAAKH
jgi:hypothetical protein